MDFNNPDCRIFVPDGLPLDQALERTTSLGIGAHPDDLESIAIPGIVDAYSDPEAYFSGAVLTTGAGAPRANSHLNISSREYIAIRAEEQIQAAVLGRYSAVIMLGYSSADLLHESDEKIQADLLKLITTAKPELIYTHNPFDSHPTHTVLCFQVLKAVQRLPRDLRPARLIGMEFWGSLEWLPQEYRLAFDLSANLELQGALLNAFQSQNSAKDYPAGLLGRRKANAVLSQPRLEDTSQSQIFGLDLLPLIDKDKKRQKLYLEKIINKFKSSKISPTGL